MYFTLLKSEITDDPLGRGYAGMTDQQVVDSLMAVNCEQDRTSMSGSEILNAIVASEWDTRTDAQKKIVWDVVHMGAINPFGVEKTLIAAAFSGTGGATIAALNAARVTQVSRAAELSLGIPKAGHVQQVRP